MKSKITNLLSKTAAIVLAVCILATVCIIGPVTAVADGNSGVPEATKSYIDNSTLLPLITSDADVTLETSDGGQKWTPDWVKDLIIVECNVTGSSANSKFSGMNNVLAHLAETGVNGIWLTPINQGASDFSNRYSNYGPETVSSYLTQTDNYTEGWKVVKKFVDLAHEYNIRVFFDAITWGVNKNAPLYANHNEWFTSQYDSAYDGYFLDWTNTDAYNYMKNGLVNMILNTGADGFRADCGSQFCGMQFYKDVRTALLDKGHKIAIFSESAEVRDGTFDFEEHSSNASSDWKDTHKYFVENNIVNVIKNGTFFGEGKVAAQDLGKGKYYSSLISCHDDSTYYSNGSTLLSYAAILSPMIPMWYLGEEFINTPNLQSGQGLYRASMDWSLVETNRDYYESVKTAIRVRRLYGDIFADPASSIKNSNICKVNTDQPGLYQAYARYSADEAVLVVPNNTDSAKEFTVLIPDSCTFDSEQQYQVLDVNNNETVLRGTGNAIKRFRVDIDANTVGIYVVQKVANVIAASLDQVDAYDGNDPSPCYYINLKFDKNLFTGNGSYWYKNMHQPMKRSQDENTKTYLWHNEIANTFTDSIYINGVKIKDSLAETAIDATHIKFNNSGQFAIQIAFHKDNNYGVDFTKDFVCEFKNGMRLGGYEIAPVTIRSSVMDSTALVYHEPARVTDVSYENNVITLNMDQFVENSTDNIADLIANKIKINEAAVSASDVSVHGKTIRIDYVSTENFKLHIYDGIVLNGVSIFPVRYDFTVGKAAYFDTPKSVKSFEDSDDALTPYYAYIATKTTSSCTSGHVLSAGAKEYNLTFTTESTNTVGDISEFGSSYFSRHIAASPTASVTVNDYIKLNGKTITECIALSGGDAYTSVHINPVDASGGVKKLVIYVSSDNSFGFDITKPFTVEFLDGLKFNGVPFNARVFTCPGVTEDAGFNRNYFAKPASVDGTADDSNAKVTNVNISSSVVNCTCGQTTDVPSWLVDVYYDKDIVPSTDVVNFYRNHLTVKAATSSSDNTVVGTDLLDMILLNGKTLKTCLSQSGKSEYAAFHVQVTSGAAGKYLRFVIPKDNTYGFNGDGDFTLQINDTMKLNGVNFNGYKITHHAAEKSTVKAFSRKPSQIQAEIASGNWNSWVFYYSDGLTLDTAFFKEQWCAQRARITSQDDDMNDNEIVTRALIADKILVNGESLTEIGIRCHNDAVVQVKFQAAGGTWLRTDPSNQFGLKLDEISTIEILDGLVVDGCYYEPGVFCFDSQSKNTHFADEGYWAKAASVLNGSISVTDSEGQSVGYNATTVNLGDTLKAAVAPAAGYQVKAGSILYSYWYRGEKRSVALNNISSDGNYAFACMPVIGEVTAKFVAIGESVNFATIGAQTTASGTKGLRFVTRLYVDNIGENLSTVTFGDNTFDIIDYGTLIGFDGDNLLFDTALDVQKCRPIITMGENPYVDFTAEIVNIDGMNYDTEFAARGYIQYLDEYGDIATVYTDQITRSVNDVQ